MVERITGGDWLINFIDNEFVCPKQNLSFHFHSKFEYNNKIVINVTVYMVIEISMCILQPKLLTTLPDPVKSEIYGITNITGAPLGMGIILFYL